MDLPVCLVEDIPLQPPALRAAGVGSGGHCLRLHIACCAWRQSSRLRAKKMATLSQLPNKTPQFCGVPRQSINMNINPIHDFKSLRSLGLNGTRAYSTRAAGFLQVGPGSSCRRLASTLPCRSLRSLAASWALAGGALGS